MLSLMFHVSLALLLQALVLGGFERLAVEAHMVVVEADHAEIDIEGKGANLGDLVNGDGPVAVDFPLDDHVLDRVDLVAPVQVVREDQDLVIEEHSDLHSCRANDAHRVPLPPLNRVSEDHKRENNSGQSDDESPEQDDPVPVVVLSGGHEEDHVVDEKSQVDGGRKVDSPRRIETAALAVPPAHAIAHFLCINS